MTDFLHHIVPMPQPEAEEVFAVYQTTRSFYHEVEQRQAFESYCDWYYQVAAQHQQEFDRMKREPNLFRVFGIGRR